MLNVFIFGIIRIVVGEQEFIIKLQDGPYIGSVGLTNQVPLVDNRSQAQKFELEKNNNQNFLRLSGLRSKYLGIKENEKKLQSKKKQGPENNKAIFGQVKVNNNFIAADLVDNNDGTFRLEINGMCLFGATENAKNQFLGRTQCDNSETSQKFLAINTSEPEKRESLFSNLPTSPLSNDKDNTTDDLQLEMNPEKDNEDIIDTSKIKNQMKSSNWTSSIQKIVMNSQKKFTQAIMNIYKTLVSDGYDSQVGQIQDVYTVAGIILEYTNSLRKYLNQLITAADNKLANNNPYILKYGRTPPEISQLNPLNSLMKASSFSKTDSIPNPLPKAILNPSTLSKTNSELLSRLNKIKDFDLSALAETPVKEIHKISGNSPLRLRNDLLGSKPLLNDLNCAGGSCDLIRFNPVVTPPLRPRIGLLKDKDPQNHCVCSNLEVEKENINQKEAEHVEIEEKPFNATATESQNIENNALKEKKELKTPTKSEISTENESRKNLKKKKYKRKKLLKSFKNNLLRHLKSKNLKKRIRNGDSKHIFECDIDLENLIKKSRWNHSKKYNCKSGDPDTYNLAKIPDQPLL